VEPHRLVRLARRQKGLFTRAQAQECGYSPGQVRTRLANGTWIRVARGVLAAAGLQLTPELRARAAQLAVKGSVIGGPSAAALWRMPVEPIFTLLIVPRRTTHELPDVRCKVETLDPREVHLFDGALITSRGRTVFDCLWLLPHRQALDLLDRALQREWITHDQLAARLHGFAGRHGARQVVRLMKTVSTGTHFAAERLAVRLLRSARIDGWEANQALYDRDGLIGVVDLVLRHARLVIELDGWAFHVTPDRFQRDRQRQNRLVGAGWTVLRFTWRDLTERPDYVITTIRATLRRLGVPPR
jgi:very-short-patch-repair endonuclease